MSEEKVEKVTVKRRHHLYAKYKKAFYADQVLLGIASTKEFKKIQAETETKFNVLTLAFLRALQAEMTNNDFTKEQLLQAYREFSRLNKQEFPNIEEEKIPEFERKVQLIIKTILID